MVVCQHGLEGRPQDTIAGGNPAYSEFASKLAERGFVTFAPQNLYIFADRFRSLQRKANPLKKTLFSLIVPQHQQICDWLGHAAVCRQGPHRLLRAFVRREVGHAHPAAGRSVLPVDLFGRFQRMGLEERLDRQSVHAT